jgi:hypothetical protein
MNVAAALFDLDVTAIVKFRAIACPRYVQAIIHGGLGCRAGIHTGALGHIYHGEVAGGLTHNERYSCKRVSDNQYRVRLEPIGSHWSDWGEDAGGDTRGSVGTSCPMVPVDAGNS